MEIQRAKKKISNDLQTGRGNSDEIPLDLIPEIFKRLPVKTLARFLCLSKEYNSIIRNRDFMKSYLIMSSTRPQSLIFTFKGMNSFKNFFFSSPQPLNQGESSVVTYHMNCDLIWNTTVGPSVHGLICYGTPSELMVYNPSTRRAITLPKIDSPRIDMHHYLGYDPIDGDYKVLCMMKGIYIQRGRGSAQEIRVLTLGKENSWRMIENFPPHSLDSPDCPDMCIDGVLYYIAFLDNHRSGYAIMSFDVRSEKFDLIKGPNPNVRPRLTRYEGKLTVLFTGMAEVEYRIYLWVLEDAVKHEWSKKSYVLPTMDCYDYFYFHPFCANDSGEIVLAPDICSNCSGPFHVLYFHPKQNSVRGVYIEGFTELNVALWGKDSKHYIVSVFSGQVDSLMCL